MGRLQRNQAHSTPLGRYRTIEVISTQVSIKVIGLQRLVDAPTRFSIRKGKTNILEWKWKSGNIREELVLLTSLSGAEA